VWTVFDFVTGTMTLRDPQVIPSASSLAS